MTARVMLFIVKNARRLLIVCLRVAICFLKRLLNWRVSIGVCNLLSNCYVNMLDRRDDSVLG